jgi:hypothetical protein
MMSTAPSNAKSALEEAIRDRDTAIEHLAIIDGAEHKAIVTRAAHQKWQADRAQAEAEVGRTEKVVALRREEAEREALQANLAAGAAQLRENELLAQRLRTEGPPLVEKLLDLIAAAAAADVKTALVNRNLPDDARIATADVLTRFRAAMPRRDVPEREKKVTLWCFASNGTIVGDQREVIDLGDGRGFIKSGSSEGRILCVRLRHRLIAYYAEQPAQRAEPIYNAIRLPRFDGPGLAWGGNVNGPAAALEQLSRPPVVEGQGPLLEEYRLDETYVQPARRPSPRIGSEVPVR